MYHVNFKQDSIIEDFKLYYSILHYTILFYAVLCYAILCYAMLYTIP